MKRMRRPFLSAALIAASLFLAVPAGAVPPGVGECMDCHGDKTIEMSLPGGPTVPPAASLSPECSARRPGNGRSI